ncbi:hypothetical protein HMPREF3107_07620 [Neisseria sp. HMSC31F04]|uniref:hypothetical protein n=1 Tax=Neisseria sp. HMSC31F04 TaxID=1581075 RepID=UPI0008A1CAEF|nr:hypothetical protein [Neisseria sp. HMSC31F04]OFT00733.1 hypothetical protein HMPREF3107_07620 [Neisseria sp. HMSC31F04]
MLYRFTFNPLSRYGKSKEGCHIATPAQAGIQGFGFQEFIGKGLLDGRLDSRAGGNGDGGNFSF